MGGPPRHGNQFSNVIKSAIVCVWIEQHYMCVDFFEEVETTEKYDGYFCSIAEVIGTVVLGSLCGFKNVSQIHHWAENGKRSTTTHL